MIYFETIFVFFMAILIRGGYKFFYKHIDFDTYFHIFLIRYLRKVGRFNQDLVIKERLVLNGNFNYPSFAHIICSFFPEKFDALVINSINLVLDAVFSGVLFLLFLYLGCSEEMAVLGALVYVCSPAMYTTLMLGPRTIQFTPRLWGEILCMGVFISTYLYCIKSQLLFLIIAGVLAFFVYLTSKFSRQALVFISLFVAALSGKVIILLPVSLAFVIAMVVSKSCRISLVAQIQHLFFYCKENLKRKMWVSDRGFGVSFFRCFKVKSFDELAKLIFLKDPLVIVLLNFPVFFLALYFILEKILFNQILTLPVFYVMGAALVYFITSIRYFLFLGESERYLIHVAFFIILILLNSSLPAWVYYLVIIWGVLRLVVDYLAFLKTQNNKEKNEKNIINYLRKHKKTLNICGVPYLGWPVIVETQHNTLYPILWESAERAAFSEKYVFCYPEVRLNFLDEIAEKYSVDLFVITDKALKNQNFEKIKIPKGFFLSKPFPNISLLERVDKKTATRES